jgi:hypothetical protein
MPNLVLDTEDYRMLETLARRDDEQQRMADVETLRALCEKYTYRRVQRWVVNLAAIAQEEA